MKSIVKMNLRELQKLQKKLDKDFFYYLELGQTTICDELTNISNRVNDLIYNKIMEV